MKANPRARFESAGCFCVTARPMVVNAPVVSKISKYPVNRLARPIMPVQGQANIGADTYSLAEDKGLRYGKSMFCI